VIFDPFEGFLNFIVYTWTTILKYWRERKQRKDTVSQQPTNDPTFKSGSINSGAIDSGARDVKSADEDEKANGNEKKTNNENQEQQQQQQQQGSDKSSQESDRKGSPSQHTLTDQRNPQVINSTAQIRNLNPSDGQSPIPIGY
jgi:hypothetical protein